MNIIITTCYQLYLGQEADTGRNVSVCCAICSWTFSGCTDLSKALKFRTLKWTTYEVGIDGWCIIRSCICIAPIYPLLTIFETSSPLTLDDDSEWMCGIFPKCVALPPDYLFCQLPSPVPLTELLLVSCQRHAKPAYLDMWNFSVQTSMIFLPPEENFSLN